MIELLELQDTPFKHFGLINEEEKKTNSRELEKFITNV